MIICISIGMGMGIGTSMEFNPIADMIVVVYNNKLNIYKRRLQRVNCLSRRFDTLRPTVSFVTFVCQK